MLGLERFGSKEVGSKHFSLKNCRQNKFLVNKKLKNFLVQKYWIIRQFESKRFLAPPNLSLKFG